MTTVREGSVYAMKVSNPAQTYWLNEARVSDPNADDFLMKVYPADYTAKLLVKGGATVEFLHLNYDNNVAYNTGNERVDGVCVTQPYVGSFLQLDVVAVRSL